MNGEETQTALEKHCHKLRGEIRDIGRTVRTLMGHGDFNGVEIFPGQHAEMRANIMLTFRHIEDARMRIGKVMQQIQGGASILDKMQDKDTNPEHTETTAPESEKGPGE